MINSGIVTLKTAIEKRQCEYETFRVKALSDRVGKLENTCGVCDQKIEEMKNKAAQLDKNDAELRRSTQKLEAKDAELRKQVAGAETKKHGIQLFFDEFELIFGERPKKFFIQ